MQSQSYSMISTYQHKTSLALPKLLNSPSFLSFTHCSPTDWGLFIPSTDLDFHTFVLLFLSTLTFSYSTFFPLLSPISFMHSLCRLTLVPLLFSSQFRIVPNIQNKTQSYLICSSVCKPSFKSQSGSLLETKDREMLALFHKIENKKLLHPLHKATHGVGFNAATLSTVSLLFCCLWPSLSSSGVCCKQHNQVAYWKWVLQFKCPITT